MKRLVFPATLLLCPSLLQAEAPKLELQAGWVLPLSVPASATRGSSAPVIGITWEPGKQVGSAIWRAQASYFQLSPGSRGSNFVQDGYLVPQDFRLHHRQLDLGADLLFGQGNLQRQSPYALVGFGLSFGRTTADYLEVGNSPGLPPVRGGFYNGVVVSYFLQAGGGWRFTPNFSVEALLNRIERNIPYWDSEQLKVQEDGRLFTLQLRAHYRF